MAVKKKHTLEPPPPPAPSRAASESIVEAILHATMSLPEEASLTAIAERAGVGIASLYRYFPNKAAIHAELTRFVQREFLKTLRMILSDESLSTHEAVRAMSQLAVGLPPSMRRIVDLSIPFAWSQEHTLETFSAAIDEIVAWLALRLDPVPENLRQRVFVAFACNRGIMIFSSMMPDAALTDEHLVEYIYQSALLHIGLQRVPER